MQLSIVDAFTDKPFAGNPAAVTILDAFPSDREMQLIASEMNLSETAFCVRRSDGDYDLRWFTPAAEVDLCGHATLATAHVVGGTARFHTRSGVLTCEHSADGRIEMDFPADPPAPTEMPADATEALGGIAPLRAALGRFDLLLEVASAAQVRALAPDLTRIAAYPVRAVIVTAMGDQDGIDFVSRVFGPASGIPEDSVTGSAHCTLAEWWGPRLGRDELVGAQVSRRGGVVYVTRRGTRVVIAGYAVTMALTELKV